MKIIPCIELKYCFIKNISFISFKNEIIVNPWNLFKLNRIIIYIYIYIYIYNTVDFTPGISLWELKSENTIYCQSNR